MVYTVYADILWLVNFLLDLTLLWGTARFGGFLTSWPRLLLAAALGAFYGVGLLFPALAPLYIMPLPLLASLLLLLAAFAPLGLRRFAWLLACFYLFSFAMGGLVLGLRALLGWGLGEQVSAVWLLPAMGLAIVLGRLGVAGFRQMLRRFGLLARVRISFGDNSITLRCFLDTGNNLREPVQGRRVLLAELTALRRVLPPALWHGLYDLYRQEGERARPYQVWLACQNFSWSSRLLLLPYSSVGEERGLLLGFVPERWQFTLADGREVSCGEELVLGICPLPLHGLKGCRAIVHPEAVLAGAAAEAVNEQTAAGGGERGLSIPPAALEPGGGPLVLVNNQLDLYKERDLA